MASLVSRFALVAMPGVAIASLLVGRWRLGRSDERSLARRADELTWLQRLVASISDADVQHLVAHRGFHHANDESETRPVENTLAAYEQAWTSGIKLCECDVAVTRDGHVVLCHDEHFARLALPTDQSTSTRSTPVGELSLAQLMALPLKSGQRPPLLEEVLQAARYIGNGAQMVIELKPGNAAAPAALCRLFAARRELLPCVAVIMSFDLSLIHTFREKFAAVIGEREQASAPLPKLMLLTVDPRLAAPGNCVFDVRAPASHDRLAREWLRGKTGTLDGLYVEFQPEMLSPDGARAMRALSFEWAVGVWGYTPHEDPDDLTTAKQLVDECGVSFVNTDLPHGFV